MIQPRAKLKKEEYGYLLEFNSNELDISINKMDTPERTKMKVKQYIDANFIIVENLSEFDFLGESYNFNDVEPINEMDLFDVERRDLTNTKTFLSAPENASKLIPANKKNNYTGKKMKGAFRNITRDTLHWQEQYDNVYDTLGILKNKPVRKPKRKPKPKK